MRNKERYSENWNDVIRPDILKRDRYVCTKCKVRHRKSYVFESTGGRFEINDSEIKEWKKYGDRAYKIFLQVAHLDHDPNNNDYSNLAAMCVKCHLNYDREFKKLARISKRINYGK